MQLNPSEISELIKAKIQNLDTGAQVRTQGTVVSVTDGICRIHGLADAMQGEMLEFPDNTFGLALNLERDSVGAVVLGSYEHITEGDTVKCTGRILEVPVGPELIGRVVNSLGQPIDGKGPINAKMTDVIEKVAPGVIGEICGDCVLPPDHVEQHLRAARPGVVTCSYCVRLDHPVSQHVTLEAIRGGKFVSVGPVESVKLGFDQSIDAVQVMIAGIGQIFSGERLVRELGGPIRIAKMSGERLSLGWADFVEFAAFISINLAFINLLPIPALDGGHLAFYAAEAVRRKPLGLRSQEWAFRTGLALVLALMLFVTINDIASLRLFGG